MGIEARIVRCDLQAFVQHQQRDKRPLLSESAEANELVSPLFISGIHIGIWRWVYPPKPHLRSRSGCVSRSACLRPKITRKKFHQQIYISERMKRPVGEPFWLPVIRICIRELNQCGSKRWRIRLFSFTFAPKAFCFLIFAVLKFGEFTV